MLIKQQEIARELFILGHRNLAMHIIGQASLSLLVAVGAWSAAGHTRVVAWAMAMNGMALFMWAIFLAFSREARLPETDSQTLLQWKWTNLLAVSVAGIGWGGLGFLFVPGAQVNNLMVMTSFAGALAYSAVSNVYDLRTYFVSVGLGTATLLSQLPAAFGDQAMPVAGMCVLYMVLLSLVARSSHLSLLRSIELRLTNQLLAQKNAEHAQVAVQANRDKSEFFAAASHDLRQPVHALLLLIEAFRQQVPSVAQHPLILHIASAGQSINTLFNALMELSRLESGTEKPVPSQFNLAELTNRVASRMAPQAHEKRLFMRCWHASEVDNWVANTDSVLMERILSNLLCNAIRYTRRGGVLVSLRRAHGGDGLWLEVWDSGVGIAPSNQTRIFDPYVQIGNVERDRTKGLGLGLSIVRHATGLLGMGLTLTSREGTGSRFRLHLPLQLFVQGSAIALLADSPGDRGHPPVALEGRKVLLVEDDDMVLQAMQALFKGWGVDLRCARRGDTAVLNLCTPEWLPECVISDFRLPGPLNGIGVLDTVLEHCPGAVGILQTGELAQSVIKEAEEAGYLVLFKPVDPALLAATLTAVLPPLR